MVFRFPFGLSHKTKARSPLGRIRSFIIDYGTPTDPILAELSGYDLAIIESQLFDSIQISLLHANSVLTAGYLSIMEAPVWNGKRFDRLQPNDLLQIGHETLYLPQWKAYIMDLRNVSCRELLLEEASEMVQKGCSGIFLDTIDDIDTLYQYPKLQKELTDAYLSLLSDIKSRYPDIFLIQNRGFFCLPSVARYLDGFLWEDWTGHWKQDPWIKQKVTWLKRLSIRYGISILTVTESKDTIHRSEAERLGFVHLTHHRHYHERE